VTEERHRWNARYTAMTDAIGAPLDWVSRHRALLEGQEGRRALDVACGRGRHALFLAELGFTVDALDVSDVALDALRDEARARGLEVRAEEADLSADPALTAATYDVIVVTYFLQRSLWRPIAQALAPNGLLVFETFTTGQLALEEGPSDERFVLQKGELGAAFGDLETVAYRETEPAGRRGRAVASLVARRPGLSA
jgi:SAM-dependent methyltransferase